MEPGNRQILFGGRLEEKDFFEALKLSRRRKGVSSPRSTGIFFLAIAAILVLLGLSISPAWLLFAAGFGWFGWHHFTVDRRSWRLTRLDHEISGSFSPDGFEVNEPQASTQWKWSALGGYFLEDGLLVFQLGSGILVFPRRFFAAEQDWQEVGRLAQSASPAPPTTGLGLLTPLPPGVSRWSFYLKKTAWLLFWIAVVFLLAYWKQD